MRYGSICSGIESASVAWAPLGWTPAFFAENDKFPSAVLKHHYPAVRNHGDITRFEEWPDDAIDLLVGGTPCQGFSIAGLRGGLDDLRSNLMLDYAAIARRYRPRWLVWENVCGVFSSEGGRDFASLLGLLSGSRIEVPADGWRTAGIVEGYEGAYGIAWRVLDAQHVRIHGYGRAVPQRRRRCFVVGYLGDWRRAAAVLFERQGLSGHPAPRRQTRQSLAADVAASLTRSGRGVQRAGESRGQDSVVAAPVAPPILGAGNDTGGDRPYGTHVETATGLIAARLTSFGEYLEDGTASTLKERDWKDSTDLVAHALTADGFDASEDGTGRGTPLVAFTAKDGGNDAMLDVSPTLRSGNHSDSHANGGVMPAIAFPTEMSGTQYASEADVSPSLSVKHSTAICFDTTQITSKTNRSQPKSGDACHTLAAAANAPTIAVDLRNASEADVAMALQSGGMGDERGRCINAIPHVVEAWAVRRLTPRECERLQGFPDDYTLIPWRGKLAPDGPRYKALGNAMACNCMRWIGHRIKMVEEAA